MCGMEFGNRTQLFVHLREEPSHALATSHSQHSGRKGKKK